MEWVDPKSIVITRNEYKRISYQDNARVGAFFKGRGKMTLHEILQRPNVSTLILDRYFWREPPGHVLPDFSGEVYTRGTASPCYCLYHIERGRYHTGMGHALVFFERDAPLKTYSVYYDGWRGRKVLTKNKPLLSDFPRFIDYLKSEGVSIP